MRMMQTKVAILLAAIVALGLACFPPQPKAQYTPEELLQQTDLVELMRFQYHSLDNTWSLADQSTLTPADFQTAGVAATHVRDTADAILQNFAPSRPESFGAYAMQLKGLAEGMLASAGASDGAAVKTAIGKIGDTCDACHAAYK
jgi:hypothetical protein